MRVKILAPGKLEIHEITADEQFFEIRNDWNKLLEYSFENSIFLTWEKLAPNVCNLKDNKTLKILLAKDGNRLLGIAPLRISRRMLGNLIRYDVIEPLAHGHTDYSSIILSKQKTTCLKMFLSHLFSKKNWDLMYLNDIHRDSPLLSLLNKTKAELPEFTIEPGIICSYFPIPQSIDELLEGLDEKFRKNLLRRLRKLVREKGKVEVREYHELMSLDDALELFFKIHISRWEQKGKPSAFEDPVLRRIFAETLFKQRDWVRIYFLTVNEKTVAVLVTLQYRNKMYGNFIGFDPEYSRYGAGNLLILKVLEKCIENKIDKYDFMQGDEPYKFEWTKKYRRNVNVKFVNQKPTSRFINLGIGTADKIGLTSALEKSATIYLRTLS